MLTDVIYARGGRDRDAVGPSRFRRPSGVSMSHWLYVGSAVLTGLAILGKAPLIEGILPVGTAAVYGLCAVGCLIPLCYRRLLRLARHLMVPIIAAVWLTALVVQSRLVGHLHGQGRGTDQGDCITVGVRQLLHGSWPYDRELMWSHKPLSCGPGWLIAHTPSAIVGYPAMMAALFTAGVAAVYFVYGYDAAAKFVVLLGITPGFWLSYVNGDDFVTFGVAVVAVSAFAATTGRSRRWVAVAGAIALSQFRLPFVLLPAAIPLDPPHSNGKSGRTRPLAAFACLASIALYGAFAWWKPDLMMSDGPLHVLEKSVNLVGFPSGRLVTCAAFVIVTVVVAAIAGRLPARYSAAGYVALSLVPLSAASLWGAFQTHDGVIDALGHWEGVSWLTAVGAVAAGLVAGVGTEDELSPRVASTAATGSAG